MAITEDIAVDGEEATTTKMEVSGPDCKHMLTSKGWVLVKGLVCRRMLAKWERI